VVKRVDHQPIKAVLVSIFLFDGFDKAAEKNR